MTMTPTADADAPGPSGALLLKVLSGPHLGAEVELDAGDHLVGADGECDIVLADRTVASRHCLLEVGAGGILLRPLDGRVMIGGTALEAETAVAPGTPFLLGTTACVLLAEGDGCPAERVAELLAQVQPQALPRPAAAAELPPSVPPLAASAPSTPPKRPRGLWHPGGLLSGVGALALCGAALLGYATMRVDQAAAVAGPPTVEGDVARIETALVEAGLREGLQVTALQPGRYLVEGMLPDAGAVRGATGVLRGTGLDVVPRIRSREQMLAALEETVHGYGDQLRLSVEGSRVTVQGFLASRAALGDLKQALQDEFQPLRPVQIQVATTEDAAELLAQQLAAEGLSDAVKVAAGGGRITAAGTAEPVRLAAWGALRDRFRAEHTDPFVLDDRVRAAVEPARALSLPIRSVALGAVPFITLKDGRVLLVGGRLDSGHAVETIEDGAITLSLNGNRTVVRYGE